DDTLRDPLMVEVCDLLAEVKILQERRPPLPGLQGVISVRQAHSVCGGQPVTGLCTPTRHAVAGRCRGTSRPYRSRSGLVCPRETARAGTLGLARTTLWRHPAPPRSISHPGRAAQWRRPRAL